MAGRLPNVTIGNPTPPPPGRGLWRLTLHHRAFSDLGWQATLITELPDAYGRRLEQAWNTPAKLTFSLNGRSSVASLITELQTDVIAWRYNAQTGTDVPYFRGVVGQSEDQLTEQTHVVTFTCHDYFAMLQRRYTTRPLAYNNVEQDAVVTDLLLQGHNVLQSGALVSFLPGSWLPLTVLPVNGDGTPRGASGVLRIRNYAGQAAIGDLITQLAEVQGGFDFDVVPQARYGPGATGDYLRVFYPSQGVARGEPWEYGGAVQTVTRAVDSGDYGNYVRVIGNNGSSDPAAAQLYSERWNADANDVGRIPVGFWQDIDQAADVTIQSTLDQWAAGDLNRSGVLVPHYTLGLRPGVYSEGAVNVGDTVPLVIRSGRLDVNSPVRVLGLAFDIGEDGQEDVSVTVGRPLTSLVDMLADTTADVNALARR